MEAIRAFLAWTRTVPEREVVSRALEAIRYEMRERGYVVYDWSQEPHNRNIGEEVREQIALSDLLVLEASADRSNLAFEVGAAQELDIPVVILRQEGAGPLPEDFGGPKYLEYPDDVTEKTHFSHFETDFRKLLESLESQGLSPGHRAARRSARNLDMAGQRNRGDYRNDHPILHMMSGRAKAFAAEVTAEGPSAIVCDAHDYPYVLAALQEWDGPIRAVADLTDQTEQFWWLGGPEQASIQVKERIYLIDWRLFFGRNAELDQLIHVWRDQLRKKATSEYEILVASKDDVPFGQPHPIGDSAVGLHLLLLGSDTYGGYRAARGQPGRHQFYAVRDEHRFRAAEAFYNAVRKRAIKFDPGYEVGDLKAKWLAEMQVGRWDPGWNEYTENRPHNYFARYDQHIRCWIPGYDDLIRRCAAAIALEILRIRERGQMMWLLEVGYGTAALSAQLLPWIDMLNDPYQKLGKLIPVRLYDAIDRAPDMTEIAKNRLGANSLVQLYNVAWQTFGEESLYDIIFGTLVMHFLVDRDGNGVSADNFFELCAKRLKRGGSLVFADSFAPEGESEDGMTEWCSWMTRNGLPDKFAKAFLAGNRDMVYSPSVEALTRAASTHGFTITSRQRIDPTRMFQVVVFNKSGGPD